jgi:hypothetical protein
MPRYFIGNILSPTDTQPEAEDPTFAFTKDESKKLKMEGVPIRMEHHPDMPVGSVVRSWNEEDGSKWILGKIDDNGFQAKFAQYAVAKNKDTGQAYYEGLSLQHTHTQYASGKTEKMAVEVSLCVDPRRPDCKIAYVDSDNIPNQCETEKVVYKMKDSLIKMDSTNTPVVTTEQPQEEQNMKTVIVNQQKELEGMEAMKAKLTAYETADKERKEAEEAKQAAEKEEAAEKNSAMVDAWAAQIPKDLMNDEQKQNIMNTVKQFPQETMELLRVAHCASQHAKRQQDKFEEFKRLTQKTQVSEKFDQVMNKRPIEVTHVASKKQKCSDAEVFVTAMKQYSSSGSARDHMEKVSQIGVRKRVNPRSFYE